MAKQTTNEAELSQAHSYLKFTITQPPHRFLIFLKRFNDSRTFTVTRILMKVRRIAELLLSSYTTNFSMKLSSNFPICSDKNLIGKSYAWIQKST